MTPAEADYAIDAFLEHLYVVLTHVYNHPREFPPSTRNMAALTEALQRRDIPVPTLKRIVAWLLFQLQWDKKFRPLTEAELEIEAAAWTLSDALYQRDTSDAERAQEAAAACATGYGPRKPARKSGSVN